MGSGSLLLPLTRFQALNLGRQPSPSPLDHLTRPSLVGLFILRQGLELLSFCFRLQKCWDYRYVALRQVPKSYLRCLMGTVARGTGSVGQTSVLTKTQLENSNILFFQATGSSLLIIYLTKGVS